MDELTQHQNAVALAGKALTQAGRFGRGGKSLESQVPRLVQ